VLVNFVPEIALISTETQIQIERETNMTADMVNGLYEGLGALFILGHCRSLWNSKQPWGVSILGVIFFTSWGGWNLYYYPSLNQWYSFFGGLAIVSSNALYIGLLIYLRRKFPKLTNQSNQRKY
jgi:hypothetical protein